MQRDIERSVEFMRNHRVIMAAFSGDDQVRAGLLYMARRGAFAGNKAFHLAQVVRDAVQHERMVGAAARGFLEMQAHIGQGGQENIMIFGQFVSHRGNIPLA